MATNSSEHLGLHLWEPTDQVLRTEFNENWQKLDVEAADIRTNMAELTSSIGAAGKNARIAWGTYTGTGSYGAGSPTGISPGFYPVVVFVGDAGNAGNYGWPTTFLRGCPYANGVGIHGFQLQNVSWSESGVSWYDTQYADNQMNTLGVTYYYVVIGYDKGNE